MLELYTDYLLSSFGATTATGLSATLEGAVSHDQVTRFLSKADYDSKTLWQQVKPMVRAMEQPDGVLIFDDTTEGKPPTDENELISWHFDHSKNRSVKGINLLNCIYQAGGRSDPRGLRTHPKTAGVPRCEDRPAQAQECRSPRPRTNSCAGCCASASAISCNTATCWLTVGFPPGRTWTAYAGELDRHFIVALKSNRTAALSYAGKLQGALLPHRFAGLAGTPSGAVLAEGAGFSSPARSPSLYKQGRQRRDIVAGFKRSGLRWPNPSARSTRNGGKWRPFIRRSNPMPPWPSRRPRRNALRATTVSCLFMRLFDWKDSG